MSIQNLTFEVIDNTLLVDHVRLLKVKSKPHTDFIAGQYFSFKINDKVHRSYSVASAPHEETLDFLIEIIEGGAGSTFINNLKSDDKFNAIGPLGFFTLEETGALNDSNPLIFIGTGSGIAPLRSMIYDLINNKRTTREIYLYFGLRFDDKAYFFDEFQKLSEKHSNFHFTPVISRPSVNWRGAVGHCQEYIMKNPLIPNARIYVCGSNKNVQSIINDLISYGYDNKNIFYEKFG